MVGVVSSFVDTLSIVSPLTAALHVGDLILYLLFLHCGYLGSLVYFNESLLFGKPELHQEAAKASRGTNKRISSKHQQWKPVFTFYLKFRHVATERPPLGEATVLRDG